MNKFMMLMVALVANAGCSTVLMAMGGRAPTIPVTPIEANKFEGVLRYKCGDRKWNFDGTSGCQYRAGDTIEIEVKVPPVSGQVLVRSARREVVTDFRGVSWVKVKWPLEAYYDGIPIVVSVTGRGSRVQLSKVYPYVTDSAHPEMRGVVDYFCFQDGKLVQSVGQGWCQQPIGAPVKGSVRLKGDQGGEYLISAKGCDLGVPGSVRGRFQAGANGVDLNILRSEKGYCLLSSAVKYDDGSIEEHELHLDWFDFQYVPLSSPSLEVSKNGGVTGCAPEGWRWLEINGSRWKDCIFRGRCQSEDWLEDGWAYALAWDGNGRMSKAVFKKE